jgi:hypothetical protein
MESIAFSQNLSILKKFVLMHLFLGRRKYYAGFRVVVVGRLLFAKV